MVNSEMVNSEMVNSEMVNSEMVNTPASAGERRLSYPTIVSA